VGDAVGCTRGKGIGSTKVVAAVPGEHVSTKGGVPVQRKHVSTKGGLPPGFVLPEHVSTKGRGRAGSAPQQMGTNGGKGGGQGGQSFQLPPPSATSSTKAASDATGEAASTGPKVAGLPVDEERGQGEGSLHDTEQLEGRHESMGSDPALRGSRYAAPSVAPDCTAKSGMGRVEVAVPPLRRSVRRDPASSAVAMPAASSALRQSIWREPLRRSIVRDSMRQSLQMMEDLLNTDIAMLETEMVESKVTRRTGPRTQLSPLLGPRFHDSTETIDRGSAVYLSSEEEDEEEEDAVNSLVASLSARVAGHDLCEDAHLQWLQVLRASSGRTGDLWR